MRKVLYIFGELTDSDVEWIIDAGHKVTLAPGVALIHEGFPVDTLYIVLDGLLDVNIEAGNIGTIANLGAGEVIGEISFVDTRPPSATVRALEPSVVWAIPHPAILRRMQDDNGFGMRFYKALSVFMSYRLRYVNVLLGYGTADRAVHLGEVENELESNILDNVFAAGNRFNHLLSEVLGE